MRSPNVKLSWQPQHPLATYIASETSTQPRITNTTPKQLKTIGYRPRTMIGFWNVRTLLQGGIQKLQYVSNCALSSGAICLKILPFIVYLSVMLC